MKYTSYIKKEHAKKDIKRMKINKNTYIISNFHYVFSKPNFD